MAWRKKTGRNPVILSRRFTRQAKFHTLVDAISGDLYRFAYWTCKDRELADELVQETYLRAWKSIDSLRDANSAKGWVFTIFRREYARQFERIRPPLEDIDQINNIVGSSGFETGTEAYVLRKALAELSEDYREPLILQVLGGFSCDEISEIMDLSKSTVMTRLFRARNKLRNRLTGQHNQAANRVDT